MSVTTQIFVYVVCVCIGIVIGAFVSSRRKSQAAPPEASQPVEPQLPVESQPLVEKEIPLAKEGETRLLSAWKTIDGRLWLEMDGQRLERKEALQLQQHQRLVSTVLELRPWFSAEEEAIPQPETRPAVAAPDKKRTEAAKPVPVIKTILEQIDDVLQVKLESSPYKERKIQLIEGPGGTVIVKDGLNRYEGVEAVPDPQIQELIRQSVKDWEKGSK